jgi:hypothetical protein
MTALALLLFVALPSSAAASEPAIDALNEQLAALKADPDRGKKAHRALRELHREHAAFKKAGGNAFKPSNKHLRVVNEKVLIEAIVVSDRGKAQRALENLGGMQMDSVNYLVSGYLPIQAIPALEAIPHISMVRPSYMETQSGLVTSQGDAATNASYVRSLYGLDGSGVTVGTMSDSFNCLGGAATDIANDDLPTGIAFQEPSSCVGMTDEGRAMMQIIHDLAPGASQLFYTAFDGPAEFATGIGVLAAAGADVIVDDVIYLTEPFFQDGPIAQAVDAVTTGQGVAYFSAAGNYGNQSYESLFRPDSVYGKYHDFDPGAGEDIFQRVFIAAGSQVKFILQWTDRYASVSGAPGASTDFDIFLTNDSGTTTLAVSNDPNIGADPIEILTFTNTGAAAYFNIVIQRFGGSGIPVLKYIYLPFSYGAWGIAEYATFSSTLFGHMNATSAEAVGSVNYWQTPAYGQNPPLKAAASAKGGTPILFDTSGNPISPLFRAKPNISCVHGGDTTFFGVDVEPNGWPNFSGTSAAAPHAAALAALLLDYDSSLSPAEIFAALEGTAVDMETSGFDFLTGYGLCNVNAALESLNNAPNTPASPNPANGATGVPITQTLSWSGGDPDGDAVTYDVWLEAGDGAPDVLVCNDVAATSCDPPGNLAGNTQYFWKVRARDSFGATKAGPVWSFTTQTVSDPGCSGANVVIQDKNFNGVATCVATASLAAAANVKILAGANVTFVSPSTTAGPGFSVAAGSRFTVSTTP